MSYVLNTPADQKAMLQAIGAASPLELFQSIPEHLQLRRPLNVPVALTEMELEQHVTALGGRNLSADRAVCFLGGGSYDHFIPAVVDTVAARSEFYTAYTPYQAEASQGSLQAFFEYQTLICQLTGLARQFGIDAGLRYVYEGNIPGEKGENTSCPGCGALLIERYGFSIEKNNMKDATCPGCAFIVDGVWH